VEHVGQIALHAVRRFSFDSKSEQVTLWARFKGCPIDVGCEAEQHLKELFDKSIFIRPKACPDYLKCSASGEPVQ